MKTVRLGLGHDPNELAHLAALAGWTVLFGLLAGWVVIWGRSPFQLSIGFKLHRRGQDHLQCWEMLGFNTENLLVCRTTCPRSFPVSAFISWLCFVGLALCGPLSARAEIFIATNSTWRY